MADQQYLSIGEVLGLLLEDFPDVTISKIRFLESQGLIEPERTPSGYRKFYDADVELLRAILHEQKANFLPLKVIRDRIESGELDASDPTGGRTPPRGIRNVDTSSVPAAAQTSPAAPPAPTRDSVFRRTDGGPEWAGGQALIPGETDAQVLVPTSPITASVPIVPAEPPREPVAPPAAATVVSSLIEPVRRPVTTPAETTARDVTEVPTPPDTEPPDIGQLDTEPPASSVAESSEHTTGNVRPLAERREPVRSGSHLRSVPPAPRELPYRADELCQAAGVTSDQLDQLREFGIVVARGTGADATFRPESVDIARVAGQLMAQGIDARHLRTWRQAAERESALFEQRTLPLLRQRNPHARQQALSSLAQMASLGAQLHNAIVDELLRQHLDG